MLPLLCSWFLQVSFQINSVVLISVLLNVFDVLCHHGFRVICHLDHTPRLSSKFYFQAVSPKWPHPTEEIIFSFCIYSRFPETKFLSSIFFAVFPLGLVPCLKFIFWKTWGRELRNGPELLKLFGLSWDNKNFMCRPLMKYRLPHDVFKQQRKCTKYT